MTCSCTVGAATSAPAFSITPALIDSLVEYGKNSPGREVCGILTGKIIHNNWYATEFHPVPNVAEGGALDYIMDPQQAVQILDKSQLFPNSESHYDVVGIFHTHPHGTSSPSMIDIKTAAFKTVYVIYSLPLDHMSFQLFDGEIKNFVPIHVEVE